jgi:hypothetical protein
MLLVVTGLALVVTLGFPEPSPGRAGALQFLVSPARRSAAAPTIVASWALGGLYLSLGPYAAASVFGIADHFLGGRVATLLCGAGALSAFILRGASAALLRRTSAALLAAGTAVTLLGMITGTVATAVAGTGGGGNRRRRRRLATFGSVATLAEPLDPADRSELFAVAYVVAYVAFSLPAVAAGCLTMLVSLRDTVLGYSAVVICFGFVALVVQERVRADRARSQLVV